MIEKIHLFDMDVAASEYGERCQFRESDVFTPGDSLLILDVDGFKIGICICFDIRYEELGRIYRNNGDEPEVHFTAARHDR